MDNKIDEVKNRILVCVDLSYWLYYVIFGAVSEFRKTYPDEAAEWIKHPEEVDQSNLPNLTNCATYVKILRTYVMKRLESIDYILKDNFQKEIDLSDGIDIIFAMDDRLTDNFRKSLYPEYKANRTIIKRSYNARVIQEYILNVIFPELQVLEKYGYHMVIVPGAEGDDVIAVTFNNLGKNYKLNVLIASDRDFLQLENVHQINLNGKTIKPLFDDTKVTHKEYLLCKIIVGDKSDNIEQVFERVGPKRALKLIKNRQELKQRLVENLAAAKQFSLNKKLISFSEIPEELTQKIIEVVNTKLYENKVLNETTDLKTFMTL